LAFLRNGQTDQESHPPAMSGAILLLSRKPY